MDNDPPQTRINQYFSARKKKTQSPSAKFGKSSEIPDNVLPGSPNSKCISDGCSPVEHTQQKQEERVGSQPHGHAKRNLALEPNQESSLPQKTNTCHDSFFEDPTSVPMDTKAIQHGVLSHLEGKETNAREGTLLKCSPIKRTSEIHHTQCQDGDFPVCTMNLELRDFTTDLISLYFSNASSTDADQSLTVETVGGLKRNVSPSLLNVNSNAYKKKPCIKNKLHQTVCVNECTFEAESQHAEKAPGQLSEELVEQFGRLDNAQASCFQKNSGNEVLSTTSSFPMRKCDGAQEKMTEIGSHPACTAFVNTGDIRETPCRSVRSSTGSMFSPGEEFWNEAIQFADIALAPKDSSPLQVPHTLIVANEESDKLSVQKFASHDRYMVQNVHTVTHSLCGSTKWTDKDIQTNANLVITDKSEGHHEENSPLPVKHFDFSNDENDLDAKLLQHGSPKIHHDIVLRINKVPGSDSSNNPDSVPKVSQLSNNRIERNHKNSDPLAKNVLLGVSVETEGVPQARQNIHGTCLATLKEEHSGGTEDKFGKLSDEYSTYEAGNERNGHRTPIDNCHASDTPSSLLLPEKVREVSEWLPSEVSGVYLRKGISKLYPWQVQCLQTEGVLQKRNLVYCASTSAGKSFVAEILMLRQVLSTGKMALLVLPYVSLCAEKAEHLETLLGPLNKHVRSFYGNQGSGTLPKDTSIAVCTIEKANSLINRLLEESRLSEVGIVVIDELHMVGDQSRGYLLELMLTKLRYATGEGISDTSSGEKSSSSNGNPAYGLQIVGMSATMPNVAAVADWLQAALYQTDFRPVPLEEYIKIGSTIFDKNLNTVRMIPKQADLGGKDPEHVVELCNEVVQEGHSVLIFCSSRRGCETTAKHVSKYLKKFGTNVQDGNYELKETLPALEALRKCSSGLDPILEETLPAGVAYHHAGLTVEEREIVESCYRQGIVRVLTATSTLAAGVNLPARRVIFRQPRIGRDFIDGVRYKQMAGRAGRTGIDSKGESMMLCKPEESKRIVALLNNSCEPLQSCLSDDKNGMTHAILEVVTAGLVQTANDIHRYVRCTLLNTTKPFKDVVKSAQDSLQWLCRQHFLAWNDETKLYTTTPLGRAAFGSSLTPEESLIVLADLSRAREGFVLASDLHLVYLVTPINIDVEPDWELYYERFMELSPLDQSVGNRIGVAEPFLMGMAHGAHTHADAAHRGNPKVQHLVSGNISLGLSDAQVLRVSRRLYVALMLCKLVQEIPVMAVCEAFKVSRGMVQGLQENAGRFASMVSTFCERLGWQDMAGLISKFQHRVSFGVRAEIVELTNIPFVKGSRARALYKAGLRTPQSVAEASISELAKALFEASSWDAQATGLQRVQVGVAKKIKSGARKIVIEQAEEARLAAFSALRSLGFSVPQLSKPLVSSAVADVIDEEAAIIKDDASLMPVILENNNIDSGAAKAFHSFDQSGVGNVHLHVRTPASDLRQDSQLQGTNKIDTVMDSVLSKDIKMADGNAQDNIVNVFSGGGYAKFETSLMSNSLVSINEMSSSHGKSMDQLIAKGPLGQRTDCCRLKCSIADGGPINATSLCGGIDSFLSLWGEADHFYFDLHFTKVSEPTSTVPFEIQGIAVCWNGSPVYYVNISKDLVSSKKVSCSSCSLGETNRNSNSSITSEGMWELLKNRWNKISFIMERSGVKKVGWNLKCHLHVLKKPGICAKRISGLNIEHTELENHVKVVDNSYFLLPSIFLQDGIDASIVPWLLWPDEESFSCPNLGKVVQKRLSVEAVSSACRDGRWRNQMHRVAHNGCCHRATQTRTLYFQLWKLLVSEELVDVLYDIENRLVNVIADMEIWGIGVDMNSCHRARKILGIKLKCLEEEACKLAGMYFSLHNAADVANILYNQLKLPIPGRSNKMKLHPSTDKQSLEFLRDLHPIVPVIKEHRTLTKLFNTLGSICSLARLCIRSKKYKIHGRWLQTSAATGRLSMEEPNLQCVEHIIEFKLPSNGKSSAEYELHQINARDFFIPTQDDWIILAADYSQIELRLMAHFSKDPSLIELLSNPDGDVFIMIAAKWTGKMLSTITNKEREQTKRLVYGILYGMGLHTLAEHLECSIDEAGEKFHTFMTSFPGVSSWLTKVVQICHKNGYIQTLKGRKRFLPKINSQDIKEKAKAQRQAVNSICQGSAADIIKIAMIKIYSVISEGCLASNLDDSFAHEYGILKGRCHIILQVHDELILEVDPSILNEATVLLRKSMEEAVSLNVPLPVKLKAGRTWGSLEPFAIDPGKK